MELGQRGFLSVSFALESQWASGRLLMRRYANVPMSLADACLVRMSEMDPAARVMTLDADFIVYRRNSRQVVPTIMPTRRCAARSSEARVRTQTRTIDRPIC